MRSGMSWVSSLFVALMLIHMPTMIACASKLSKNDTIGSNELVNMTWSLNNIPQLNRRIITQTWGHRLGNTYNASIVITGSLSVWARLAKSIGNFKSGANGLLIKFFEGPVLRMFKTVWNPKWKSFNQRFSGHSESRIERKSLKYWHFFGNFVKLKFLLKCRQ